MTHFGELGRGRAHLLQVPAIVDRVQIRHALETDRGVRRALQGARDASVAMFSL
jgi:deoxyribonucleoside regulator